MRLVVDGQDVDIRSTKVRALLAYVALGRGSVSRDALSYMLWTRSGRRNLRQLLYQVRQLPGAESWLDVDSDGLTVNLDVPTDGDRALEGDALHDLDDAGTEAFADWVLTTRERLNAERDAVIVERAATVVDTDPDGCLVLLAPLLEVDEPPLPAAHTALRAYQKLGKTERSRALWSRVQERVSRCSAEERTEWAALRLDRPTPMGHSVQAILPDLRRLVELEPDPPPASVIAKVLGVDLLDIAVAWPHIEPAESAADDVGTRALRTRLAEALQANGDLRRAAHHYHELGETRRAADLWWRTGAMEDDLDALLRCAETSPDPDQSEDAWGLVCIGHRLRRELDQAHAVVARMVRAANASQRSRFLARARVQQASLMMATGDTEQFEFACTELHALIDVTPSLQPLADLIAGTHKTVHRRPQEAIPHLERGMGVGRVEDLQALLALGAAHGHLGQLDEATDAHRRGLALARKLQATRIAASFLVGLSATADRARAPQQARRYLLELLDLAEYIDGPFIDLGRCNLATVDMTLGDLGSARTQLGLVLDTAPAPNTRALVYRTRSELERVCGRYAESAGWSERARSLYAELEQQGDLDIIAFNLALADHYLNATAASEAAVLRTSEPILARGGHFANLVARDVALVATDPERVQALLPHVQTLSELQHDLLAVRAAALRDETPDLTPLVGRVLEDTSTTGLWARHLLVSLDPTLEQLRDGVDDLVATIGTGLLSGQREALAELVATWAADPVTLAGPL